MWGLVWKVPVLRLLWAQVFRSFEHVAYSSIRPKFLIFNIRHDGTLSFRNFIMMVKQTQKSQLWASWLYWPTAMIRPKSQKFNIEYDGTLSIGNFMLIQKNNIALQKFDFSCPVTGQQPKNVLLNSVATWNFLFIII
jgi:hypothetical protein